MRPRRLAAGWVLPVSAPPIPDGAVLIGAGGRIEAVGPDSAVPRPAEAEEQEVPECIVLPGLVNTHTHLELTGLGVGPPGHDFPAWIGGLRRMKAERPAEEYLEAARRGLAGCWAAGVTTIADTGDSGAVIRALAEAEGSGVAYHEVFGPHPDQLDESLAGLRQAVRSLARHAVGRVRLGVSPHAPYTVSGPLYAATAAYAEAEDLPLAVHLAESRAESELVERAAGAFAAAWERRGIPLPPLPGRTPVEWLDRNGVLGPRTLCIHVVQAGASDLDLIAERSAAVALCPLSNRAHGHGDPPLAAMLDRRIRLGVGTDSALSVGAPDLLAEARAARTLGGLDADRALGLCTLAGAAALGLEREIGSLERGKWADCVVLRAPGSPGDPPAERALASGPGDVVTTYLGGRVVYHSDTAS